MDRRIETAIRIMHVETHCNLPIAELAQRVNLSSWHFIRLFKAETSKSPKYYIRHLRMKQAEQLLSESFLSVKEIAAKVGFGDRSHFSRDFKRLFGQAPAAFRANNKCDKKNPPRHSLFSSTNARS